MSPFPEIKKEVTATILFGAAGVVGAAISPGDWQATAATGLFYLVLLINTYFSIWFFGALPPKDRDERVVDGMLVVSYLALGLSMGRVVMFTLVTTLLFIVAIAKYVLLMPIMDRRDILRRKIVIDSLGLLLCAGAFAGALAGYPLESAWAQAVLFAVANGYLLLVRPMYVA